MTLKPLTKTELPRRTAYTDYGVRIQPVRSPVIRFILYGLPWAILIVLLVDMTRFKDILFFSALATAAFALFAFQMLMQQIPEAFDILWSRNIIALHPNAAPAQTQSEKTDNEANPLVTAFANHLKRVDHSLNHIGSLILGLVFGLFGIARFPYEMGGLNPLLNILSHADPEFWFEMIFEGLIGFVLGLMVWRMVFTAIQISQLEKHFDLQIKFDHPDRAGGLEPLGNLCLWNALILTIPGIFLGGWILIGPRFQEYQDLATHAFFYNDLYYKMIIVPIILAPIAFALPLWSTHRIMAEKALQVRRDLDNLGERIDRLGRELLSHTEAMTPEEAQGKTKNLDLMQAVYQANQNIPVWPLNTTVLIKFATSQIVPLLGLTGLGQPILKVVDALAKFIGP
jgi:hypothetical protein